MNKVLKRSCLLLVFLLCTTTAFAGIRKGPYLLFEGKNTSMAVLWQTDANETNTIRWGTDTSYSMGQASVGVYGSDFQHKHVITGLQPDTKYYYKVDGYGLGSFLTAPTATATTVKLFAYGDTRSNHANQEKVVTRMRATYAKVPTFQTICLHAGDWVARDDDENWTNEWFVGTNPEMHAFQSEVPIVGSRGNHENIGHKANIYKKYFPEPYNSGGFYWSFDYGPVHVAVVDQYTTYTAGSAQYTWLDSDLAASTKPWKFVVLHEPGWSSGGGHGDNKIVKTYLQPLFKKYGVQLVIGGHNHYYARGVVDGVQHLTLGGGGAPFHDPEPIVKTEPIVTTDKSYHHAEIDINGNDMIFTARRDNGEVIESLNIPAVGNQPLVANTGATDYNGR